MPHPADASEHPTDLHDLAEQVIRGSLTRPDVIDTLPAGDRAYDRERSTARDQLALTPRYTDPAVMSRVAPLEPPTRTPTRKIISDPAAT